LPGETGVYGDPGPPEPSQVHALRAEKCGVQVARERGRAGEQEELRKEKQETAAAPTEKLRSTETFFSPALRAVATSVPGAFFLVRRLREKSRSRIKRMYPD
jgi:hypothetical protein